MYPVAPVSSIRILIWIWLKITKAFVYQIDFTTYFIGKIYYLGWCKSFNKNNLTTCCAGGAAGC
jgi:hypothetical protein